MIQPNPFKLVCPNCSYSKVIKPKSDVLNPIDMNSTCLRCGSEMKKKELKGIDKIFASLF